MSTRKNPAKKARKMSGGPQDTRRTPKNAPARLATALQGHAAGGSDPQNPAKVTNRADAPANPAPISTPAANLFGYANPSPGLMNPDVSTVIQTLPGMSVSGGVSLTRRLAAWTRFRDYLDPLVGFNVAQAMRLSEDFTRGWMADLQWTYFFLEWTDEDLFALVDRRLSRLLEMDVVAKRQKEADKVLADEQAAMIEERLGNIDNLSEAIEHLALAKFRGYAHLEKWRDKSGVVNHLELVDQWNVVRDGLRGGWKYNPRALQCGYFSLDDSMVIDPVNFLVREERRHINRVALLKYTSKKLTQVDWDAFVEIYGIPSGVVIGPQNVPTDKVAEYQAAAEAIAQGGSGYLPYGSLYEKNDFPGGQAPFKERLEYLTEKLILVGTGGLLTMLTRSGSGTLAGNAHADVFEQLAKADARDITGILNRGLINEWIAEEFPGKPRAAQASIAANEETKVGDVVQHIKDLYTAGLAVDAQDASERTGYKLTRIVKPDPAAAGDKPGADGPAPKKGEPAGDEPADPKIANRRRIINAAGLDVGRAVFDRNAKRAISEAQLAAVTPLLDRLAALKDTPDADLGAALQKLRDDLPRLFAEARLESDDVAEVWEQVLSTALLDGLVDQPIAKK